MITVNYSTLKRSFYKYFNKVAVNNEIILITRKSGGNVVMMSESEYNSLMENLYVRSNPANHSGLLDSIDQLKTGNGQK